jgi:predicted RNase H-like HicB family nuclease
MTRNDLIEMSADDLIANMVGRGFSCTSTGDHVLLVRDGTRLVLPGPGRQLPLDFVRRIDCALESLLGPGWLLGPRPDDAGHRIGSKIEAGDATVHLLDAIVTPSADGASWCSFLPDEITVMGFGRTRDAALRDLKHAAALWIGIEPGQLVLVTPTIV